MKRTSERAATKAAIKKMDKLFKDHPELLEGIDADTTDEDINEGELHEFELPGDLGTVKQIRPAWTKGTYLRVWNENFTQNKRQRITCAICKNEIKTQPPLSPMGKEVYNKVYKNQTKPHIDHDAPDWVIRYDIVQSIIAHANPRLTPDQAKRLANWAMNTAVLRLVHKECNLIKSKYQAHSKAAFEKQASAQAKTL